MGIVSVHDIGEPSLTYLGGRFSHAIRRRVILAVGGGFIEGAFSMPADPAQAADDEIALAERTLAAIREIMLERGLSERDAAPLYARFDLIRADDGTPLLLEAELFEPHYFTAQGEGSLDRFVEAVDAELSLGRAV